MELCIIYYINNYWTGIHSYKERGIKIPILLALKNFLALLETLL